MHPDHFLPLLSSYMPKARDPEEGVGVEPTSLLRLPVFKTGYYPDCRPSETLAEVASLGSSLHECSLGKGI